MYYYNLVLYPSSLGTIHIWWSSFTLSIVLDEDVGVLLAGGDINDLASWFIVWDWLDWDWDPMLGNWGWLILD